MSFGTWVRGVTAVGVTAVALQVTSGAQDRLKAMPGYEQFEKMRTASRGLESSLGTPTITWSDDSSTFEYTREGKRYRFDVATRQASVSGDAPEGPGRGGRGQAARGRGRGNGQPQPARGRQFDSAESPDRKVKAFYKDRNLWISDADGGNAVALTTDGNDKDRIKYGTASWVYGEELDQRTAMWWSPDSRALAYYRFDEKQVIDYYLPMTQTEIQDTLDVEAYPKPGKPNPSSICTSTTAARKHSHPDRRPRRQAVRRHRRRPLRLRGRVVSRRHGAAVEPDQPSAERPRVCRVQSGDREVPDDRPRRMAHGLGREQPAAQIPGGREALRVGVRAQRLEEPLSLRSQWPAALPADDCHDLRDRQHRPHRRGEEPAVLHGA